MPVLKQDGYWTALSRSGRKFQSIRGQHRRVLLPFKKIITWAYLRGSRWNDMRSRACAYRLTRSYHVYVMALYPFWDICRGVCRILIQLLCKQVACADLSTRPKWGFLIHFPRQPVDPTLHLLKFTKRLLLELMQLCQSSEHQPLSQRPSRTKTYNLVAFMEMIGRLAHWSDMVGKIQLSVKTPPSLRDDCEDVNTA